VDRRSYRRLLRVNLTGVEAASASLAWWTMCLLVGENDQLEQVGPKNQKLGQKLKISISFSGRLRSGTKRTRSALATLSALDLNERPLRSCTWDRNARICRSLAVNRLNLHVGHDALASCLARRWAKIRIRPASPRQVRLCSVRPAPSAS
jgi:hypothetical protein